MGLLIHASVQPRPHENQMGRPDSYVPFASALHSAIPSTRVAAEHPSGSQASASYTFLSRRAPLEVSYGILTTLTPEERTTPPPDPPL